MAFEQFFSSSNSSFRSLLWGAKIQRYAGHYAKALTYIELAMLSAEKKNKKGKIQNTLLEKGDLLRSIRNLDGALDCYQTVVKMNLSTPIIWIAYFEMAMIHIFENNIEKASLLVLTGTEIRSPIFSSAYNPCKILYMALNPISSGQRKIPIREIIDNIRSWPGIIHSHKTWMFVILGIYLEKVKLFTDADKVYRELLCLDDTTNYQIIDSDSKLNKKKATIYNARQVISTLKQILWKNEFNWNALQILAETIYTDKKKYRLH